MTHAERRPFQTLDGVLVRSVAVQSLPRRARLVLETLDRNFPPATGGRIGTPSDVEDSFDDSTKCRRRDEPRRRSLCRSARQWEPLVRRVGLVLGYDVKEPLKNSATLD
jgi:hypothetical protein